jgi:hypothetical protein
VSAPRDLNDLLADFRGDAAVLRRAGHEREATLREQLADQVAESARDWLTWLSETDAALRSGRSREWLRGRFADLERDGLARMNGRDRQYRACAIPRRSNLTQARAAGIEAARAIRDKAA